MLRHLILLNLKISIHAPARGATVPVPVIFCPTGNFNPRSREGSDSDQKLVRLCFFKFQSTLPRGERPKSEMLQGSSVQFQSTLPRGERPLRIYPAFNSDNFNPRSREGSDPADSILSIASTVFQSTLPRGERQCSSQSLPSLYPFQSTLPRGERLRTSELPEPPHDFNPRSREGSDDYFGVSIEYFLISIHAPARGATGCFIGKIDKFIISIHAPARGATKIGNVTRIFCPISIHAPARGATALVNTSNRIHQFQSTLPRGERHRSSLWRTVFHQFQSTLPRGERPESI